MAPGAAVEAAVKEDGKDAFDAVVLQTFDDPDAAVAREHELLLEYDAADSPDWYNRSAGYPYFVSQAGVPKTLEHCAAMGAYPNLPVPRAPRKD